MNIIDAHIHFCPGESHFDAIARLAGHENTGEHLEQVYAGQNIRHAVVMGNRGLELERHQYPPFLSYCVGLDSSYFQGENVRGSVDIVEQHLQRRECVGIKVYAGYCHYYVDDPVYHPYYELAMAYNKPVAIHTGATANKMGLLKYSHPLTVDDVATRFPKVQFVMCHFGNPWLADAAAVMDKNPNVAADLSGLLEGLIDMEPFFQRSADYIRHLRMWLEYLGGYDRIMYGTDWPLANIGNYIEFATRLLPEHALEDVFFHNANRIYQLGLE